MTMDKMSIKTNTRITIEKSWKENKKPGVTIGIITCEQNNVEE